MLTRIADFLEREGGSVVAAFGLMVIAFGMYKFGFPKAEDIVILAAGAIIAFLKGKASRITTPAPMAEGTTSETTTKTGPAPAPTVEPEP